MPFKRFRKVPRRKRLHRKPRQSFDKRVLSVIDKQRELKIS